MKKERASAAGRIVAIAFALLVFGAAIVQFVSSLAYLKNESKVTRLGFAGTYKISDDDVPKPINSDNMPNIKETDTIIFNGCFDHDIELNEELFFKINYLDVTILKTGWKFTNTAAKTAVRAFMVRRARCGEAFVQQRN